MVVDVCSRIEFIVFIKIVIFYHRKALIAVKIYYKMAFFVICECLLDVCAGLRMRGVKFF